MPAKVRWTAENDQILFMKILETHEISVDSGKVAAAWPGEEESRPTGRAIKERITKIKEILKNSTGKSLAGPSTPGKRPRNKVAKTPKAPKTPKDSTPARRSRKKNNENSVKFEAPIKVESTDEDDEASEEAAVKTEEAAVKTEAAMSESDAKAPGEHETWSDLEEEL
ncbi:hypothetical protein N7533_006974 [Penicillium manginii]|uniref:uncharacterized protein n=1 Tax=Penicillium manginii TaxID=203109 RepID=UPI002548BB72|nr:uncharacterized protein N7533_006974 [Penicillium manginii]KAJ5749946.1 hypothetical protein N7533_006974 [Penicillium manginii]